MWTRSNAPWHCTIFLPLRRSRRCRNSSKGTSLSATSRSIVVVSDMKAGLDRVIAEHAHGLEGERREILADHRPFLEDVGRDRDDMAPGGVGLKDVEHLARARPNHLCGGRRGGQVL